MEHKNTLITIAISAIVGAVVSATITIASNASKDPSIGDLSVIESQLLAVKTNLVLETQARIALAQRLDYNRAELNPAPSIVTPNAEIQGSLATPNQPTVADQETRQQAWQRIQQQRNEERLASQQPAYRKQQLVNAGFAQEEAARIVQLESEESLRQLQNQYTRQRQQATSNPDAVANANSIRTELGEQNYERYLEANGWPTSASIGSIIGGSAGENAGLKAGDNVVSYAGKRVFNLGDINNLTVQGIIGESVLIEVERNGESVQLTIPRGPIGIDSGTRFRR